ncbi:MAG: DUF6352 family protein [Pseudomonadota bacterium]|nr:DUF6352 family protein [Pseudomonadota bacterium]
MGNFTKDGLVRAELWPSSGFRLLQRDEFGRLSLTENFLRDYLEKPQLAPGSDSCDEERNLHANLVENPFCKIEKKDLSLLVDTDVQENYGVFLNFRDKLRQAESIEACYQDLFLNGSISLPESFIDHMAQVVLRNILDDVTEPFQARASELLFRRQTVSNDEGGLFLVDSEVLELLTPDIGMQASDRSVGNDGLQSKQTNLVVLQSESSEIYWDVNEQFNMVLDLSFSRPGLDALCRVLEAWVFHFLNASVTIQPIQQINDERWVWHVGLDRQSSNLLNDLYMGKEVEPERMARVLSLFRLEFKDYSLMKSEVAGSPIYMALSMSDSHQVRLKPQNLLVNLPLANEI